MRKGTSNTKLRDAYDIMRAYAKLYNYVNNDEMDSKKARLLLAILNGASNHLKTTILETRIEDIEELIKAKEEGDQY